jgi:hypothetical protein
MQPDHDLVAHLYGTALALMREHGQVFLPLEVVRERLGWSPEVLGEVVDHCVALDPVAAGALKAEWMDDGDRPAFGACGQRFIGIRPVDPGRARA